MYAPCLSHTLAYTPLDSSPSPKAFRGASYTHTPSLPAVQSYSDGRGRSEAQFFGFPTQSFSHTAPHEECSKCLFYSLVCFLPPTFPMARPGCDAPPYRSGMSGLHHPIRVDQYPSQLSSPIGPGGCAPEFHVASGSGATVRNGFGWRLRPVSELRASEGCITLSSLNVDLS